LLFSIYIMADLNRVNWRGLESDIRTTFQKCDSDNDGKLTMDELINFSIEICKTVGITGLPKDGLKINFDSICSTFRESNNVELNLKTKKELKEQLQNIKITYARIYVMIIIYMGFPITESIINSNLFMALMSRCRVMSAMTF